MVQGRYIVALQNTVDHKFVTDLLQKRFPEYEIYTGKEGPCVDLIDIKRVSAHHNSWVTAEEWQVCVDEDG